MKSNEDYLRSAARHARHDGLPLSADLYDSSADELAKLKAENERLREALMLAEKADRIHSNCHECNEFGQAAEVCDHCFPSADDARVVRRNVLQMLGVLMRDVDRIKARAALDGAAK